MNLLLSDKEKLSLLTNVAEMLNISQTCRIDGIFAIEDKIKNSNDNFLKIVYDIITESHELQDVRHVIKNILESSYENNVEYVKHKFQSDALLLMASHPVYFINIAIFSNFGINFKHTYKNELKKLLSENMYITSFVSRFWNE